METYSTDQKGPFDEEGKKTLHVAVRNNNVEMAKYLLDNNADVNEKNENHNTPLHLAVERNNYGMAKVLLECGADPNVGDESEMTPLHYAVRKNNSEITTLLLDNGALVNALTKKRETVLHTAAMKNYIDMVKLLIANGAELETLNMENFTAVEIAAESCHFEIVDILLNSGAAERDTHKYKLHLAAGRGDCNQVQQYLREDCDIEFKNAKLGHTALHWAAKNGSLDVVKILLQNKAEVNSIDMLYGDRPLHKASYEGHANVVQALIEAGANKESVNYDGHRAIHDAAAKGHLNVMKILLKIGADKNVLNAHGESPLIQAAEFGHADVVNVLLEAGADRHLPNDYGVLPICQIARRYNDYTQEHGRQSTQTSLNMLKTLFYFFEAGSYINTETKETLTKLQLIAKIFCHRKDGNVQIYDILDDAINCKVDAEFGMGSEMSIMVFGTDEETLGAVVKLLENRHLRTVILGNMDVGVVNSLKGRLGISHCLVMFNVTSFSQYIAMSWLLLDSVRVVCLAAVDIIVPYKVEIPGYLKVFSISHCKLLSKDNNRSRIHKGGNHNFSTKTSKRIQFGFRSVRELFLNNNGLTDLAEDIGNIPGLKAFSAHDNNIHHIPLSLVTKSDYASFAIHNNPAVVIPVELQERGKDAVLSYLRDFLVSRSVANDNVKLILAGHEGSGKTTLVRALCDQPTNAEKTDGIEMATIALKDSHIKLLTFDFAGDVDFLETHTLFVTDDSLIIVTFDLSKCAIGQKSTSANSLNQYGRVLLWLQTIHVFAPNARVIIVGTHADITMLNKTVLEYIWQRFADIFQVASKQHQRDHHDYYLLDNCFLCQAHGSVRRVSDFKTGLAGYAEFDNRAWSAHNDTSTTPFLQTQDLKLPHIVGYYEVSSVKNFPEQLRNGSIKQLQCALVRQAELVISDLLPRVPASWCKFREKLTEVKQVQVLNPVMRYSEYESLARGSFRENFSADSLRNVTAFLCSQGNIILREGTVGFDEGGLVILNPEWLASLLRTLISFKTNFIDENGVLTVENLRKAWVNVNQEHHDYLVRLLVDMGICFRWSDYPASIGSLLFPCKLPIGQPSFHDWPSSPRQGEKQASQMYQFSFLPPLLFCDLIVKVNRDLALVKGRPIYYANQIVYLSGSEQAVKHCGKCREISLEGPATLHHIRFELLYHSNSILVTVRGEQPCCALEQLAHLINEVWQKAEYRGLSMATYIPCPKCIEKGETHPGRFEKDLHCSLYQSHRFDKWHDYLSSGHDESLKVQAIVDTIHRTLDNRECPKLFLVLPVNEGSYSGMERFSFKVFSRIRDGFAVHLLCESPGNYHFLGTPGYRINRLNQFVKKYGSYVCRVLKFIGQFKGVEAVAGPTPVAAGAFAVTGVSSFAGNLLTSFLEDFGDSFPDLAREADKPAKESLSEFAKQDDSLLSRRELARFLGKADEERRFGGLVPIAHGEGVVWVCEQCAKLIHIPRR